jgi:hypothetical protein
VINMLDLLEVIISIGLVIILCILVLSIDLFQSHLHGKYKKIWEGITFRHFFFISRNHYPFPLINHNGLKLLLFKSEIDDKTMVRLRNRIRILLVSCIIQVTILVNL